MNPVRNLSCSFVEVNMPEGGESKYEQTSVRDIIRDAGDYHDLKNKVQLAADLLYLIEREQREHAAPEASAELQDAQQALERARNEFAEFETQVKNIYGSLDEFRQ